MGSFKLYHKHGGASFSCLAMMMMLWWVAPLSSAAGLSPYFYDASCPEALSVIRTAISRERRMGASLLRLHFHDCFVNGCDASVLLDDTSSMEGEKGAVQNEGSLRGFEVIDSIKSLVESRCPGVVSCADVLAIAALDSSEAMGGPKWEVKLGRRDSPTASKSDAENNLPPSSPQRFRNSLLSSQTKDSVKETLIFAGARTIGQAQCATFKDRIYNGSNIDAGFARMRRGHCPEEDGDGDSNLAPLDLVTPTSFDKNYFKNLIRKGLLDSDQVPFGGGSTDPLVVAYSKNRALFYADFAAAMVRMGDISPLTGSVGQVREVCRAAN
ncbi:Peroxidase 4 [Nymphaea thermarum]|nr:Peroxidase 4 [Nymphaea thermarum]